MSPPAYADPVELSARRLGDGPPVFVLHGLLGQARNWQAVAKRLSHSRSLYLVDLRNHGASPAALPMTYEAMAADLLALADREAIGRFSLVGHSMGGKAAMATALLEPARVERLCAVDVAPVDYHHDQFGRYIRAMQAIDLGQTSRRAEVEAALLPVEPDPRIRAFLASNLGNGERLRWMPNLANLLQALPMIVGFPPGLLDRSFTGPTLFLCGALSDYLRPQDEPLVRRLFPHAATERIADAGHWLHADRPEQVIADLDRFLPP